jgi:outer membrane lipoprotein SlyB
MMKMSMNMNMNKWILALGSASVLLTGCQNPDGTQNNTGSGLLIGGALGALTGAALGGRSHGGQDALIGAAAGALAGGLIGNSADREQEARLKAQAPQTYARVDQGQPLSVADIKELAKAGIDQEVIINQISSSHTVFHLSSADIIDLRDSGVPDRVVNYMINTASAPPSVVVEQAPPPAPVETVVVAPGPDYMWIDGEWVWQGGGWVWIGGHWGYPPHPHAVWIVGRSWHDRYGWHHEHGYWR